MGEPGAGGLPSGTVTLLLADVEGSTRLWESAPEEMRAATARLDEVLAAVLAGHGGARPVEQGEGDSFVVAFRRASDAVACALDLQRSELAPLRLRMGIHTGEVQLRDEGNYMGSAIIRCARLRDLAHGGQIVLSQAARDLVVDGLPPEVTLRDLGSHRMRDLDRPEQVYQLCHPELPDEFPPLRSLDASPNNLPVQLTSFIGRTAELDELRTLLDWTRLLTLTGSGGAGKTRLALQLAAEVSAAYPDGLWQADLAPVSDPGLVATSVARALGYHDEVRRSATETIVRHVGANRVLLILDNCEHLIGSCAELADVLLRSCPSMTLVATSREPLGVAGEVAYRVPSLRLPSPEDLESEAVELFLDRARRARPGFDVTERNRAAVTQICQRLDGIPLALELAAARVRAFSVEQIADGLHDRFRLLTGGMRTALPRQQTLRASVDWSYHLLTEPERVLFDRLSVFAGTFDFAAAEVVGAGGALEPHHVLDLLGLLVDKSLVLAEDEAGAAVRYRMLETVRQYGLDHLSESGEILDARRRHRDHYLSVASRIPFFVYVMETGEDTIRDLDNFRVAIQWSIDTGELHEATRLVCHLHPVWNRGRQSEGRAWYDAILPHVEGQHRVLQAWAFGLSASLETLAQSPHAVERARRSAALARELGDPSGLALALGEVANARLYTEGVPEWEVLAESEDLARQSGDPRALGMALFNSALAQLNFGDPRKAEVLATDALAVWLEIGAGAFIEICHAILADTLMSRGHLRAALEMLDSIGPEGGRDYSLTTESSTRAWALALMGDVDDARAISAHAVEKAVEDGMRSWEVSARFASGVAELAAGDALAARSCFEHGRHTSVGMWRRWSDAYRVVAELGCGDMAAATRSADECAEELTAWGLSGLEAFIGALVALASDGPERAAHSARRAIETWHGSGNDLGTADALDVLAAASGGVFAARLCGAAARLRREAGAVRLKIYNQWIEPAIAAVRADIGDEAFEAAWAEGATMSRDEAVAYALRGKGERKRPTSGWASLTPTELDVVRLVADGLANKEIAARLFISPRTVQAHLTHVYAKLGTTSRVQLAKEAAAHA